MLNGYWSSTNGAPARAATLLLLAWVLVGQGYAVGIASSVCIPPKQRPQPVSRLRAAPSEH